MEDLETPTLLDDAFDWQQFTNRVFGWWVWIDIYMRVEPTFESYAIWLGRKCIQEKLLLTFKLGHVLFIHWYPCLCSTTRPRAHQDNNILNRRITCAYSHGLSPSKISLVKWKSHPITKPVKLDLPFGHHFTYFFERFGSLW